MIVQLESVQIVIKDDCTIIVIKDDYTIKNNGIIFPNTTLLIGYTSSGTSCNTVL